MLYYRDEAGSIIYYVILKEEYNSHRNLLILRMDIMVGAAVAFDTKSILFFPFKNLLFKFEQILHQFAHFISSSYTMFTL